MGEQIVAFPHLLGIDTSWLAPKKSKKISLNEFLGDSSKFFKQYLIIALPSSIALGSWADEMEDSLPNAREWIARVRHASWTLYVAARNDEENPGDRPGRKEDFLNSRRKNRF